MATGEPGAPFPPAVKPAEEVPGHGQGSVTILPLPTEEPSVQEKLRKQKPATRKFYVTSASS